MSFMNDLARIPSPGGSLTESYSGIISRRKKSMRFVNRWLTIILLVTIGFVNESRQRWAEASVRGNEVGRNVKKKVLKFKSLRPL